MLLASFDDVSSSSYSWISAAENCFVCLDKLIKFFFLVCLLPEFHSGEIKISKTSLGIHKTADRARLKA